MGKAAVGVGLLTSAFAPVVALVAVVQLPQLGVIGWLLIGGSVVAVGFLAVVLGGVRRIQARTIQTKTVRSADEAVLAFTASYVIPVAVAAFAGDTVPALVGAGGLVLLLVIVYVRGGLYHLNPTLLAVFGYRLYEVTASNEAVTMLLSREKHIPQSGQLQCRYLSDHVAIQIGRAGGS